MDPVTEARVEAQMNALCRSMDQGFASVHKDLDELKTDVKALHQEGLPRRVSKIEKWRDSMNSRFWRFLVAAGAGAVVAWLAVIVPEWGSDIPTL